MVSAAAFCQFYLTGDLFLFLSFIPSQSILTSFQFEFSFSYYSSTITPNVNEINITVILLFIKNLPLTTLKQNPAESNKTKSRGLSAGRKLLTQLSHFLVLTLSTCLKMLLLKPVSPWFSLFSLFQTVELKSQAQQCPVSASTQMTGIGCYVSCMNDRLVTPGTYTTADEHHDRRLRAVSVHWACVVAMQCFWVPAVPSVWTHLLFHAVSSSVEQNWRYQN